MAELPHISRALFAPGPQAPLSHFGVTLLRHCLTTGLRYALYQLGLPIPQAPPVRIVRLRLYLETAPLSRLLEGEDGGAEAAAALVDPGGLGPARRPPKALAGALAFHRLRLAVLPRRLPRPRAPARAAAPEDLWRRFRRTLSRLDRPLGDALLADLCAALNRRAGRAGGGSLPPCSSREAWRLRRGGRVALERFGPLDLREPSWARAPEAAAEALKTLAGEAPPPPHRLRGRFRHTCRAALERLAPLYAELAGDAAARGLLERPDDAFFLPLDLGGDLALRRRPGWLPRAVLENRTELASLAGAPGPEDVQRGDLAFAEAPATDGESRIGPLWPLP